MIKNQAFMNFIFYIVVSIIIIALIIYVIIQRKSGLSHSEKLKFSKTLQSILLWHDHRYIVIHLDTLLDKILLALWYKWSLWEKMKKYWKCFLDENGIWHAHKMRNKLVHEIDFNISTQNYSRIKNSFIKEITKIIWI